MKKLTFLLALIAAAAVALPSGAAAAKKPTKKKGPAIYKIAGLYKSTSVIYSVCHPGTGGTVEATTTVERTYLYSGDTKKGFTVKRTEQIFRERKVTDNEYLPNYSLGTDPEFTTRKLLGSEVLNVNKKGKGLLSYDGIEVEKTTESFKLPALGQTEKFPIEYDIKKPATPTVNCPTGFVHDTLDGSLKVTRIQ